MVAQLTHRCVAGTGFVTPHLHDNILAVTVRPWRYLKAGTGVVKRSHSISS